MGTPVTFTPDNEPYLGRQLLYQFDQVILSAMEVNEQVSSESCGDLSPLQRAACQIIPQGFSIALSIRELIRQGYLLSAEILIRPLVERAATISYLVEGESALSIWERGWNYKERPSLSRRLLLMRGEDPDERQSDIGAVFVDRFNSMVHGDPASAERNLGVTFSGEVGYLSSKNLCSPEKCDEICSYASMFLVVLLSRAAQIFPVRKR